MRNNNNRQKNNRQQQQHQPMNFTVQPAQTYAGIGPASWTRSDEFIEDDICKRLYRDNSVDATGLQVSVENGNLTLGGYVPTERQRSTVMTLASGIPGLKHLNNHIEIASPTAQALQTPQRPETASAGTGGGRTSRA